AVSVVSGYVSTETVVDPHVVIDVGDSNAAIVAVDVACDIVDGGIIADVLDINAIVVVTDDSAAEAVLHGNAVVDVAKVDAVVAARDFAVPVVNTRVAANVAHADA